MTGREIRAFLAQNSEAVENLARMARGKPIRRYGPGGKTYYSEVDFPTQKWAIGEVVERLAPRLKSAEVTGVDGGPVASETHVHRHGEDNLPPEQLFDRWIQFALRKRQAEQNASAEFASPPGEAARRPGATDAAPQAGAGSGSNGSAPVPAEQLKPGEQIDIDDYAIRLVRDEGGTQDWAVMARGNPRDQQIKRLPNSSEARARQWLDLYLKEQRGEI